MEFWNSLLTQKSWDILKNLRTRPFTFIVIGGWATYLWTKLHKSKDVDIIVHDYQSLEYLKSNYLLVKNDQLRKYEIKMGEIDIDIYVPFYSHLPLPIEILREHSTTIENLTVVRPEILLILKQGAELERGHSIKGQKDRIDIIGLLVFAPVDFSLYHKLLEEHHLESYAVRLKEIINGFIDLKHLNLNPRQWRKKKEELVARLRKE